ncbi:MAG: Secreted effector protein pipB2 [bacterium ADurb.BinA186]|nr:MAG: Secreted effector protein pipB2 [bacterium ADurb.BinA186]
MTTNLFLALSMLLSTSLFSMDSHRIIIEEGTALPDAAPAAQLISENRLDFLPIEIICIIAEYLPNAADIENLERSMDNKSYHVKEIYWKKKALEDFGPVRNKAHLKSIDSALGKRERNNSSDGYEETKYKKLAEIFLKKNISNLLKEKVIIQPYRDNKYRTYFIGAHFIDMNLNEYILCEGNYSGANFFNAKLMESDLRWTKCVGANFSQALLVRANLSRSDLSGSNFADADLTGANFLEAKLDATNFAGANVTDASFPDISKFKTNFEGAFFFSQEGTQKFKNMLKANGQISWILLVE